MEFLIDGLLPTREVHLIGGPSGAGKTTLILQMLYDWSRGIPVFGKASRPVPYVYVACDRSLQSIRATMDRIQIPHNFPLISMVDDPRFKTFATIREAYPEAKFYFMDGFPSLTPKGKISDYEIVSGFLTGTTRVCQELDISIAGTGHTTKCKEGETFVNPRQRFLGSVAWGGFSDTMMLIEPAEPDNVTDLNRTVMLLPRNGPGELLHYRLNDRGVFVPQEDILAGVLHAWLLSKPLGTRILLVELAEVAEKAKISRVTMFRQIKKMIADGVLVKVSHGTYQLPRTS